ncbi:MULTISPECIES: hypothetical protein [unclassified Microbacterium]|uniref:hypothetical protein n=1 Tax=unclassified Microbacterium TaxID=2609290 RepID=UPI001604ECD1|nr:MULTISPECIES: hypothetical protein [unclassified Microbacterium]QNA93246.1 hypothetical protein G4G29_14670 [Microbacterium sp. Se63.02b]QYM63455.1 hypothetical protein K1X59_14720 [Microbacterium sp. Se5.02b]
MASSQEAQNAILDSVKKLADEAAERGGVAGTTMLRDAAYAYRAVIGGQQPGGIFVDGK